MYYKCEWCGEVDNDPKIVEDRETGWRGMTCRRCGSDVTEAETCVECEGYFAEDIGDNFFHTAQGEGFCGTCLKALCNVKTALEYFAKYNLLEEFVDTWLLDGKDLPYAKSVLLKVVDNATDDDEALQGEMWSFIEEDASHFADYVYEKRKGATK